MILLIDGKIEEVPDFTHAVEEAMEAPTAVIELDVEQYGTVQAEKLLRIFCEFFRECTTFKGDMRGYIVYEEEKQ